MLDHPQPYLSRPPSYRPDYRWPVVVVAAVPTPLVGPSSGRILWVQVSLTFFPPRSETSHRSLYERLSEVPPVEAFGRSPVALFAQSSCTVERLTPPSSWANLKLDSPLATPRKSKTTCEGRKCFFSKSVADNRGCRCPHTPDNGRL